MNFPELFALHPLIVNGPAWVSTRNTFDEACVATVWPLATRPGEAVPARAYAALFAAAPELHALVVDVMNQASALQALGETNAFADKWLTRARAVIAKVDGATS